MQFHIKSLRSYVNYLKYTQYLEVLALYTIKLWVIYLIRLYQIWFLKTLLSRILDIEVDIMMKIENTILVSMYCCHQLHSLQCKEREAYRR